MFKLKATPEPEVPPTYQLDKSRLKELVAAAVNNKPASITDADLIRAGIAIALKMLETNGVSQEVLWDLEDYTKGLWN